MDSKSSGNAFTTRERDLILGKERYSFLKLSLDFPFDSTC